MSDDQQADKIRAIGAAIQQGKLPTTSQAVSAIEKVQESGVLEKTAMGMSIEGKRFMTDVERTVEDTKTVLAEKFPRSELQDLIATVGSAGARDQLSPGQVDLDEASDKLMEAGARTARLARVIVMNPEFRKAFYDTCGILQGGWIPRLWAETLDASNIHDATESAESTSTPNIPSLEEARKSGKDTPRARTAADVVKRGAEKVAGHEVAELAFEKVHETAAAAEKIKDEAVDTGESMFEKAEMFVAKLLKLPEEKKNDVVRRFKDVAKIIQKNAEYQSAIDDLFAILKDLSKDATSLLENAAAPAVEAASVGPSPTPAAAELEKATTDAKKILENFASGKPLAPLLSAAHDLVISARDDDRLNTFYTDAADFLTHAFKEPAAVDAADFDDTAKTLVVYEARTFTAALAADRASNKLVTDLETLMQDLFLDEKGSPTFKPEMDGEGLYTFLLLSHMGQVQLKTGGGGN
ncbi:hypothetical protein BDK51DRAFT_52671 [Blyttiomyces helicus]|uniref:HAM1-like N-terminal domain-containing protein n=1 Tax=Blyttiomyces helicus TaxID=388810 RepID=A0A4P9WNP5_9FUNG|nr:hypothetical protein BDK51DRAFT_52671 [Blyttiomyces helicus]|eukprot:RKO93318.1 hypothetical protein BDK51DRAFT_52671 [Blyttiomyces helicus]